VEPFRRAILETNLKSIDTPLTRSARRRKSDQWAATQAELIDEITGAAARIAAAKDPAGDPVFRTDAVWALLSTIDRSHYCCCLSDVGRLMMTSRQHAQRLALKAEDLGMLELARNPDDRRIVQLFLTKRGRDELAHARSQRSIWTARLLLGLDRVRLMTATHVVRVIRQRLARDESERRRASKSA
jgi:DNA-binding MarR family transcriptional regulator